MNTPNTTAPSLLPCPFCDGKPVLKHIGNDYTKKKLTEISCSTIGCFAAQRVGSLGNRNSFDWCDEKAAANWNNRPASLQQAHLQNAEMQREGAGVDNAPNRVCAEWKSYLASHNGNPPDGDDFLFVLVTAELMAQRKVLEDQPPAAPSAVVLEALQGLVDDLNLRAVAGVVAVGNGVWVRANDALAASQRSKADSAA